MAPGTCAAPSFCEFELLPRESSCQAAPRTGIISPFQNPAGASPVGLTSHGSSDRPISDCACGCFPGMPSTSSARKPRAQTSKFLHRLGEGVCGTNQPHAQIWIWLLVLRSVWGTGRRRRREKPLKMSLAAFPPCSLLTWLSVHLAGCAPRHSRRAPLSHSATFFPFYDILGF